MGNVFLGLLFILAGVSMFLNGTISFGFFEKNVNGWERYIYTFPEILLGFYMLYYEYRKK